MCKALDKLYMPQKRLVVTLFLLWLGITAMSHGDLICAVQTDSHLPFINLG